MKVLLELREEVGVNKSNLYFFAAPDKTAYGYVRADASLSAVVKGCVGMKRPDLFCTMNLRNYLATVVQGLNLSSKEQDWLLNYIEHTFNIHMQIYRQHKSAIEATKIL